jgi:hypothetical protein
MQAAIHGYLTSSDATTAAAFTLYDVNGNAYTLASGDRVLITSLAVIAGGTANVLLLVADPADSSAAGGVLWVASVTGQPSCFSDPIYGVKGKVPGLLATVSGTVVATINGFVIRS